MALTTLEAVKAFKNILAGEHDAEIKRLIPAAQQFIESYLGRPVEAAGVTEYHSTRAGQTRLLLDRWPVTALTSLADDPDRVYGAATLLAATDYVLADAEIGLVVLDGLSFQEGINNVKVVYQGGYAAGDPRLGLLAQASIELIWLAHMKGDQNLLGMSAKSIADGNISLVRLGWPGEAQAILDLLAEVRT
jgi:hypothetical protein